MARSRSRLLGGILFGLLASNITFTIFNVALVDIAKGLHTTSSTLTWAITGPLLTIGVSAPMLGRLGDVRGHRQLFLAGLVGSLLCAGFTAVAPDALALIGARLLSGLGAAALTASSWALLFRVYGPAERTKVLGWWSLVSAGGPVIGVALGGPVVQAFGWRWIFVAQIPLVAAALAVNWRILPATSRVESEPLDVKGALLLALAVGAVLLAINRSSGGFTVAVASSVAVAAAAFPAFVWAERRASAPVLPLEWFADRAITLPALSAFAMNFAYMGGFFLTPLFLEQGLRYSVGAAGFFQIARPLVFALTAPAAGYMAVRTGERLAAVAGGFILLASMLVFAMLGLQSAPLLIVAALGASGMANGMAVPSLSAMVAGAVDPSRMGSASAAMQVASQIGVVAGIQVMETVQVVRQPAAGVIGSYHSAYLAGAAVTLVSIGAALAIRRARPRRASRETLAAGGPAPLAPPALAPTAPVVPVAPAD